MGALLPIVNRVTEPGYRRLFFVRNENTNSMREVNLIRLRTMILVTMFFALTPGAWAQGKALQLSQTIPLPELHDGDFEHFALDIQGSSPK